MLLSPTVAGRLPLLPHCLMLQKRPNRPGQARGTPAVLHDLLLSGPGRQGRV